MEEWRPVVGFEELYEVSNLGQVRRTARLLRPSYNERIGYPSVTLVPFRGAQKVTRSVHRLVAAAFIGEPPSPEHHVNHKDGDKGNAEAGNLEYVTVLENIQHAVRMRLFRPRGADLRHRKSPARRPMKDSTRRKISAAAKAQGRRPPAQPLKTHCLRGHELSAGNLVGKDPKRRVCKTCRKQRDKHLRRGLPSPTVLESKRREVIDMSEQEQAPEGATTPPEGQPETPAETPQAETPATPESGS